MSLQQIGDLFRPSSNSRWVGSRSPKGIQEVPKTWIDNSYLTLLKVTKVFTSTCTDRGLSLNKLRIRFYRRGINPELLGDPTLYAAPDVVE